MSDMSNTSHTSDTENTVNTNSDEKQEKRFIDPKTGAPTGTSSSGGITGSGSETSNQTNSSSAGNGEKKSTSAVATGHSEPGGNIGGRNPGTSSATIGDQDSTQARSDMDTVDSMTSREPGDLDKINPQGNAHEIARRDP